MNDKLHRVIGIDLGTTYSAVAVYDKYAEQAIVLRNEDPGNGATTPSVVGLDPITRKMIVGMAAKRNLANDPANTVIEIKREMGEMFREETLDKFQARGKFRPRDAGAGGFPGDPVRVRFSEFGDDWFMPQEISALILMKLKQVAEHQIGEEIRDAVVTVPAYFTEKQKKATEEAALLAGLYPRQLMPEPTAAAICFGVDRLEPTRKNYLVYDLGGGTFDVSIISVEESNIDVVATSGDPRLGGGDFDDAITAWAAEQLESQCHIDVRNDPMKKAIIKVYAEQTKKELSSFQAASLTLVELRPEQPPTLQLTRQTFEELVDPLLRKSLSYVDTAIRASEKKGLRREDIDAILLVGGSSKIPKVKTLLLDYFQRDESFVRSDLDPDAVVARGAAAMALRFAPSPPPFDLSRRPSAGLINRGMEEELRVNLITEHSLGLGVQNNLFSKIIDQGTNIPVSKRQGGFTNAGPTDYVEVPVYQGEGQYVYENSLIGTLRIGPMEAKPEGFHQFEVTFSLDDNGLLAMTVHHINEGKNYQAQFEQKTGVGGDEALKTLRSRLLKLYSTAPASAVTPSVVLPTQPVVPPPGMPLSPQPVATASPPAPVAVPVSPATASPQPVAAAVTAPVATAPLPAPSGGVPLPADMPGPAPIPLQPIPVQPSPVPPAPSSPAAAAGTIVAAAVEVPAEFKSIVRRAHKQLLSNSHPKLLAAFNAFTTALNSGMDGDELTELGDELADVYQDCRA